MIPDRPYRPGRILSVLAVIVTMTMLGGCVVETPGNYRVGRWTTTTTITADHRPPIGLLEAHGQPAQTFGVALDKHRDITTLLLAREHDQASESSGSATFSC